MRLEGWKLSLFAITTLGLGAAGGVYAKSGAKPEMSIVVPSEAKFVPAVPGAKSGPQIAVLSGNPATGPVAFLLKVDKGQTPVHWHTSDYFIMTLKGETKHWVNGKAAEAKVNPVNTFWFQPGGADTAHGDECMTDGGCLSFLFMPGKTDINFVAPPKK